MYSNKILMILVSFGLSVSYAASNDDHDDHEGHGDEKKISEHNEEKKESSHDDEDEAVTLTQSELKDFDIEIGVVKGGAIGDLTALNGEIRINENLKSTEMARFGGVIQNLKVQQGQYVKKGDVIAVIQNNNNLAQYKVVASQSGIVTNRFVNQSAVVSSADAIVEIVDFSSVWVEFAVYHKDMAKIRKGQNVKISDTYGDVSIMAKIDFVESQIDETTRTLKVRATVKNKEKTLRPGMFVKGLLATSAENVKVLIPQSAIHNYENKKVVFVSEHERFEARPIKIGHSNELYAEIESGLNVGEKIVVKNGFVIKSELEKSEMSGGHNH